MQGAAFAPARRPAAPPVRVLDLKGVRQLEDALLLRSTTRGEMTPEGERLCDDLCARIFGVTADDVAGVEWTDLTARQRFDFERLQPDAEQLAKLKRLGLDFSDEQGRPLRCTERFAVPALIASKGLLPQARMPEPGQGSLDRMEAKLAAERDAFLAKRRGR